MGRCFFNLNEDLKFFSAPKKDMPYHIAPAEVTFVALSCRSAQAHLPKQPSSGISWTVWKKPPVWCAPLFTGAGIACS